MNARSLFFTLSCFSALTASTSAQLNKVGEIFFGPGERATGIAVERETAWVSLLNDGMTSGIDLTIPSAPVVLSTYNPGFGDQWAEPVVFMGDLASGHRFGGANLTDVTNPLLPTSLDTQSTTYHHDGLQFNEDPGNRLLLYSEHNASGQPGGLRVFDVSGGTLNEIGNSLIGGNLRDGRFLENTFDQWVYQLDLGAGSTRPLMLNVYDVNVPTAPAFVTQYDMGNVLGNASAHTDLALAMNQGTLYAACGFDGLRCIDISIRPAPNVVNTLAAPGLYVRELSYLFGSTYMVASVTLPSGQQRFRVLDCSLPNAPFPIWTWFGDADYQIFDLQAVNLATGPAVLVCGIDASGEATFQVWQ